MVISDWRDVFFGLGDLSCLSLACNCKDTAGGIPAVGTDRAILVQVLVTQKIQ